jgi:hypothetical protein
MSDKIITLKPFHTFEIRTTTVKFTPPWYAPSMARKTESTRILSVFNTTTDHSNPKKRDLPLFYIDTEATASTTYLPFTSQRQTLSTYPPSTNPNDLKKRTVSASESLNTAHQTHTYLAHFMCTIGGINSTTPSPSPDIVLPDEGIPREIRVGSGLGHGKWYDPILSKALGLEPPDGNRSYGSALKWKAFGDDWRPYLNSKSVHVEWEGHGAVKGGGLLLKGRDKVLVMYKPRCARWASGGGEEVGTGVLGVLSEEMDEEMCRYAVLCAVSIEQQIMRSKGFEPMKYHGCWD